MITWRASWRLLSLSRMFVPLLRPESHCQCQVRIIWRAIDTALSVSLSVYLYLYLNMFADSCTSCVYFIAAPTNVSDTQLRSQCQCLHEDDNAFAHRVSCVLCWPKNAIKLNHCKALWIRVPLFVNVTCLQPNPQKIIFAYLFHARQQSNNVAPIVV